MHISFSSEMTRAQIEFTRPSLWHNLSVGFFFSMIFNRSFWLFVMHIFTSISVSVFEGNLITAISSRLCLFSSTTASNSAATRNVTTKKFHTVSPFLFEASLILSLKRSPWKVSQPRESHFRVNVKDQALMFDQNLHPSHAWKSQEVSLPAWECSQKPIHTASSRSSVGASRSNQLLLLGLRVNPPFSGNFFLLSSFSGFKLVSHPTSCFLRRETGSQCSWAWGRWWWSCARPRCCSKSGGSGARRRKKDRHKRKSLSKFRS